MKLGEEGLQISDGGDHNLERHQWQSYATGVGQKRSVR